MRDKISIPRVQTLHPKIREEVSILLDKAEALFPAWIAIRVVEAYRSFAYQNALYAQGRTKPGPIVTNARGGFSFHCYGLALDFAFLLDKDKNGTYEAMSWDTQADLDKNKVADWSEVVKVFTDAGYEWGGNWKSIKDLPHVQKRFGYTEGQLLLKYNKKDFLPGTEYVNL